MCTLWIGIQFVVADMYTALWVQATIPAHILLSKICIGKAELKGILKTIGDSPVEYLYDTIYNEPDMP